MFFRSFKLEYDWRVNLVQGSFEQLFQIAKYT